MKLFAADVLTTNQLNRHMLGALGRDLSPSTHMPALQMILWLMYHVSCFIQCQLLKWIPGCRANRLAEIKTAHKRYVAQHLKNSSTRGVLAAAFTPEVADEYMTAVMFDSATE